MTKLGGGRCGGDELAVLLPGTDRTGALRVADRLQRGVRGPGRPATADERSEAADAALREAKIAGRGRVMRAEGFDPAALPS